MRKCIACHQEIGDVKFCGNCGEQQTCNHCEKHLISNEQFCQNCGTKRIVTNEAQHTKPSVTNEVNHQQAATSGTHTSPSNQTPKKKNTLFIVGGIIAALLIAYFMLGNDKNQNPEVVVENFFKAMNDQNMEKLEQYVHPTALREMYEYHDLNETLRLINVMDLSIELLSLEETYRDEYYVDYDAYVRMEVTFEGVPEVETDELYIELEKFNDKWYIIDIY